MVNCSFMGSPGTVGASEIPSPPSTSSGVVGEGTGESGTGPGGSVLPFSSFFSAISFVSSSFFASAAPAAGSCGVSTVVWSGTGSTGGVLVSTVFCSGTGSTGGVLGLQRGLFRHRFKRRCLGLPGRLLRLRCRSWCLRVLHNQRASTRILGPCLHQKLCNLFRWSLRCHLARRWAKP